MKDVFLESKHIYLRPFKEEDIDIWHGWFNDKEVTKYSYHGVFPNTREDQRGFLKLIKKDSSSLQLAIVLKRNNKLIGVVGLHQINYIHQNGDVSIVVGDKNFWGLGYAKEAVQLIVEHGFMKMNLNHITAGMVVSNKGSSNLFKKLGFIQEGLKRKHKYINGKFEDVLLLGILKSEFIKKNK